MDVGLIGLGRMGTGIAKSLLRAGHRVTVYNRTRERAEPAEDIHRFGKMAVEKFDDDEIEQNLGDALQAVVRSAVWASVVGDGNFRHLGPHPACENRNEAVHLAVEPHALDHVSSVGFERASVVMQLDAGETRDQMIGDNRGPAPRER